LLAAVRRESQSLDSNLPVFNAGALAEHLRASLAPERSVAVLIATDGLLAIALASIGLYGVMAYTVSQQTREIGIRMALGAQTGDVMRLVIKQGMGLTLSGAAIGIGGAASLTRALKSWLFGVGPTDPLTFAAVALLLFGVALLACYIPARRATKVDPLTSLRSE